MTVELALVAGGFAIAVAVVNGIFTFLVARHTNNRADERERGGPPEPMQLDASPHLVESPGMRRGRIVRRMYLGVLLQLGFCTAGIWASMHAPHPDVNVQILRIAGFCTGIALAFVLWAVDFQLLLAFKFMELFQLHFDGERGTLVRTVDALEALAEQVKSVSKRVQMLEGTDRTG